MTAQDSFSEATDVATNIIIEPDGVQEIRPSGFCSHCLEISQLNEQLKSELSRLGMVEQALRQSEERFRTVFEEAPMGIGVFDLIDRTTYDVNAKYAEIVGRTREEMLTTDWADITHPEDLEKDLTDTNYLLANPGKGIKRHKRYVRPNGTHVWAELTIIGLKNSSGLNDIEITIMEDITEKKMREQEILYLNYHDVLTRLYNRAFVDEERARLEDPDQLPVSVIMGDINGLKLINDAFGHQAGDRLLVQIADILKNSCRHTDTIARIGGDEFLILLPKTDRKTALAICAGIQARCDDFRAQDELDVFHPSMALGTATRIRRDQLLDSVVKSAEDMMYRRKLLDRKSMHSSLIASIKATMFEKSHETEAHAARLVELSRLVGLELNLGNNELNELDLLATLHDIGKISVDDHILNKAGKLTEREWAEIRKHPEAGYRIAQASPELSSIAEYILCHHEHWNGKGYPQGLKGEDIPLLARIISVVDAYDAMTQDRSYRKAMQKDKAVEEILKNAGVQFDPVIARLFAEIVVRHGL